VIVPYDLLNKISIVEVLGFDDNGITLLGAATNVLCVILVDGAENVDISVLFATTSTVYDVFDSNPVI
jgi:hypothetical protein